MIGKSILTKVGEAVANSLVGRNTEAMLTDFVFLGAIFQVGVIDIELLDRGVVGPSKPYLNILCHDVLGLRLLLLLFLQEFSNLNRI